jgi:hypothetical protein
MLPNSVPLAKVIRLILLCAIPIGTVSGQCTNNNTAIAGGAITPPCPGTMTVACVNSGEYALVNVAAGRIYEFSTCGATYNTEITLFNNAGGGSIGYNNDACGEQSLITWTATFNGQVRVLVDRYVAFWWHCNHNGGCVALSITCLNFPPPVTNNECANAIDLFAFPGCFMQAFSNVGATNSSTTPNPTCGYNGSARDVWFRFTVPPSGVVVIRSRAFSLTDGAMQIYSGTCGALSLVECDDDDGPGLMPMIDRRCVHLTPNQTYYLRFWGYNGSSGTFGICVDGPDFFLTPQQDCAGGFTVCNSGGVNNSSDYTGCTQDLSSGNHGCLLNNERQGTWYYFSPQTTGTIAFDLTPINSLGNPSSVDYDFAIWGPFPTVSCPPAGNPLRCSYALPSTSGPWNTGMAAGNVDLSEPASGNGFVAPITIAPAAVDQVFVMYLDNWDLDGQAFNLTWNLSNPALLDCTVLPVRLLSFDGVPEGSAVRLNWVTQALGETERFFVQHSSNGADFVTIGTMDAVNSGNATTDYVFFHKDPLNGSNFYRLEQVDRDGSNHTSNVVHVEMRSGHHLLVPRPNPASNVVYVDLPSSISDLYRITLMDASGRMVSSRTGRIIEDLGKAEIPLFDLDAGCYVVHVNDEKGNSVATGRFIKE